MHIEWNSLGYKPVIFLGVVVVIGLIILTFGLVFARRKYNALNARSLKKQKSRRKQSFVSSAPMPNSAYNLLSGASEGVGSMYGPMPGGMMMQKNSYSGPMMQGAQNAMHHDLCDVDNGYSSMMMGQDMMPSSSMYGQIQSDAHPQFNSYYQTMP